jgi:hypothetical protein
MLIPYEDEVKAYSDDELYQAICEAEAEVKSNDGADYDLESLVIRLATLKGEKDQRAARSAV